MIERIRLKAISPTGIIKYIADKPGFFRRYGMGERDAQTHQMAIGSAFDCRVKAYLHSHIYGPGSDPNYDFENMVHGNDAIGLRAAIDEPLRARALEDSLVVFGNYVNDGGLADLMQDVENSPHGSLRMEFDLKGDVEGVPLFGKPDLYYLDHLGRDVVHDWKVNGFYGKASPKPGYIGYKKRGSDDWEVYEEGVNQTRRLEDISKDWATQISMYGWMIGIPVGVPVIGSVHQITGPDCRVTRYKAFASEDFQQDLMVRIHECWDWLNAMDDEEADFLSMTV